MIPLDPLQTPAMVLGMAGAVLVAGRGARTRAVGFGAWMIGNLFWVAYGIVTGNPYVMVMFAFYWVTAVVGLFNARPGPRRDSPLGRGDRDQPR